MEKGSGTRSGLLWEVERILLELKEMERRPDVLLMENVPQVCGTANIRPWNDWLDSLHRMGYTNYFKILNAKDYAIPQNRERCFMVSILGNGSYAFPSKLKLRYRLKDFLDEGIDEKYYLSEKMTERFVNTYEPKGYSSIDSYNKKIKYEPETSNTLTARYQVPNHGERIVEPKIKFDGSLNLYGFNRADNPYKESGRWAYLSLHGKRFWRICKQCKVYDG